MRVRLAKYIEEKDLFYKDQHGFVKGNSCATNLLETLDIATKALSKGKAANVVYLDFLIRHGSAQEIDTQTEELWIRKGIFEVD